MSIGRDPDAHPEGSPATAELPDPHLRIEVLSIFPDLVSQMIRAGVIGRGERRGLLDLRVHDLRSVAQDPHKSVDDAPFGGGAGMVLAPGPVFAAVEAADPIRPLYLLGPGGRRFDQRVAEELAEGPGFSLLCGRYEGVDDRVREHLCDGELSIGDVVLAGGEAAAMVVVEAVGRLVPGVLGNSTSTEDESFADGLLEYPHYTRPADFRGWAVPDILLSGHHDRVRRWRLARALARTLAERPDLIHARGGIRPDEAVVLEEMLGIATPTEFLH